MTDRRLRAHPATHGSGSSSARRSSSRSSSSASSGARCTGRRRRFPPRVRTSDGAVLMSPDDILTGQQVWQSTGGQQLGSIWGHGAYQAPGLDGRLAPPRGERAARRCGARASTAMASTALDAEPRRRRSTARLTRELRTNTFDPATRNGHDLADRAAAMRARRARTTTASSAARRRCRTLRRPTPCRTSWCQTPRAARRSPTFFFWTSWAAGTNRPGLAVTYTNNWPHEPLIGNAADQRQRALVASSAWCCCWPASARSCGGRRSARQHETERGGARGRPVRAP